MSLKPVGNTSNQGVAKRVKKVTRHIKRDDETAEKLLGELAEIRRRIASLESKNVDHGVMEKSGKKRQRSAMQSGGIPIPSYTWQQVSGDFVLVDFNDAAVRISDTLVNLVGKTAKELNGHIPEVLDDLSQCFSERSSVKREVHCSFNDIGEARHLAISYGFVLPDLILVHTEDITDSKDAEEEILRLNRELNALKTIAEIASQSIDLDVILSSTMSKVREILNIKHAGVALVDEDGRHLTLNVHLGISNTLAKGFLPMELGKGFLGKVVQSGEPLFDEALSGSFKKAGKKPKELAISEQLRSAMCVPLVARGNVLGAMYAATQGERVFTAEEKALLMTIGHQLSLAVHAAAMLDEISQAKVREGLDEFRMGFLASVSHEIRTPLTSIKGLASTLLQTDVQWDAETQKDFLRHIDQESDRLMRMVNDILDISKLQVSAMHLDKTINTFDEVINDIRDVLYSLTNKHRFELIVPDVPPLVFMDELRIGQVITNLVKNAVSYSSEDTVIILEVKVSDGNLIVSVIDQGDGIPVEFRERVFDRFTRLEGSIKRRKNGSGLGLAICKGIVEGHGGKIWVESKVGKGSRFRFSLSVVDDSEV